MQAALILLALVALVLSPNSAPTARQEPSRALTVPEGIKAAIEKLMNDMQGVWRLDELQTPLNTAQRRQEVGFCVITNNYMALELHLGWLGDKSQIEQKDFQSGTYRFELREGGFLDASTVIGSFINQQGLLQFELPNTQRHYQVEIVAERMTLRRKDGQKLVFVRLPDDRIRREAAAAAKAEQPASKSGKETDR